MAKRRSPDSVVCIDLTEDDDEEREEKLGDVRKRLKSSPSSAAELKVEGQASGTSASASISVDDDDDGGGKIGSCAVLQHQESSEVQIIEPVAPTIHPVASAAQAGSNADDDIVLVGTANESRLPHMRQHCPEHKFTRDVSNAFGFPHYPSLTIQQRQAAATGRQENQTFCDKCFCYVCDKPASECLNWTYHCNASDTGIQSARWKNLRQRARQGRSVAPLPARAQPRTITARAATPRAPGAGPFEPGHELASTDATLTKCRKCGWYNRFDHKNFGASGTLHPVGFLDWCHSCGRVASEKDFGKVQAVPYTRKAGDVFLGEKTIPFRIFAHDPRKMDKFKQQWNRADGNDPNWAFAESEMEEEVFKHRFGKYPSLEMIFQSIPVVGVDDLPETGSFHLMKKPYHGNPYYGVAREQGTASADETEGIILESQNDRALLQELINFGTIGYTKGNRSKRTVQLLDGDITANWNATERSGEFTVRLFLQSNAFCYSNLGNDRLQPSLSKMLGTWFNIFPFALSELRGLTAEEPEMPSEFYEIYNTPVPPFRLTEDGHKEIREKVAPEVTETAKKHNEAAKAKLAKLSLNPSTENDPLGGISADGVGLAGALKRYFSEIIVEDAVGYFSYRYIGDGFVVRGLGVRSLHRDMRRSGTRLLLQEPSKHASKHGSIDMRRELYRNTKFESYLREGDHVGASTLIKPSCRTLLDKTKSMNGMLDHLENLHHASVPFVEGLTVELLDFQRQTVQWALERETAPGGVQSFLWPKLPFVAETGQDVYYSPILQRFRREKPQLVRGGFIAEEMGLGKTIISLALILQNPAPVTPLSGSPVASLNDINDGSAASSQTTWDPDLYTRTSETNNKRGSILSRGTLVVCHVSLVGQWIDEAKSKLKDPGLVYPYHGQSRKRDAQLLAKNSIVVTTYQTLASDATYHAKKRGDGYCAPCEQVRWWRVICDESHSLREGNTQRSKAVMNLVADHKWLVSGTPVNTSFKDLKNQLKFIGIENIDAMFNIFTQTAFRHSKDPCVPKKLGFGNDERKFGPFMFFLRCLMMRHTQKHTYRGTTTTLMSLPPKVERTIEVEFSEQEKNEYAALDNAAHDFYVDFKGRKGHELSKYYLLLTSKLMPLRIACSGGHIPLDSDGDENTDGDDSADELVDDEPKKRKKKKKEQRFSEFAYNSKLKTLIEELKRARDEDPNAKSLVFSQFTSTLGFLQQELPKHGFQFRTLSGDMSMRKRAKALHDFQHDPPTTIFLLSMRAGAVGINLTQANRVFLMEPSFTPALELQAIGRVHRLGQKRNVEIVRLVMKDSVETRILDMLKKKYGHGATSNDDVEHDDDTKVKANVVPLVGSLKSDRTTVLAEEFDLLFGTSAAVPPHEEETEAESQPMSVANI